MPDCQHGVFECRCSVARLTDDTDESKITGYSANIRIVCAECGIPFEWVGVLGGYSPSQPMASVDNYELRAPIKPSSDPAEAVKVILKQS
jgi:hypothetical protein